MYETDCAYYLDADDEEPDCGRCDNFDADDGVCKKCGPEYGWARYCRKELKEVVNESRTLVKDLVEEIETWNRRAGEEE